MQQEEPSEAINERLLGEVIDDKDVKETLDRHMLPVETETPLEAGFGSDAEGDEDDTDGDDRHPELTASGRPNKKGDAS